MALDNAEKLMLECHSLAFARGRKSSLFSEEDAGMMPLLDILFRQVPEGFEFLAVLLTILGSLGIMVLLGAWWSR